VHKRSKGLIATGLGVAVAGAVAVSAGATTMPGFGSGGTEQARAGGTATGKAKAEVREDFNGDGYNDLAIGAPGGSGERGYVTVVYGSAQGLDRSTRSVIDQDTPGVPGTAEEGNRFGDGLFARDLDGDGVTDLVASGPSEEGGVESGLVALWGVKGEHLSGDGAVALGPSSYTAAGDFTGDGAQDLFVTGDSASGATLLQGPFTRQGKPAKKQQVSLEDGDADVYGLTAGDITGDGTDDLIAFRSMEEMARPGAFLKGGKGGLTKVNDKVPGALEGTIGDFDGDGHGDLAYRVAPGGVVEGPWTDPGTVKVQYGASSGPGSRTTTLTQSSPGVPGASEEGDVFGASLAAGDTNGDHFDDLAVGVPGEAIGSKKQAGATVVLKGSAKGLSGTGSQAFDQGSTNVPGAVEPGDMFGGNTRLLDFDKDGKADLAVSAPGENDHSGAVWSLPGGSGGTTAQGAVSFAPSDLGTDAPKAVFGSNFGGSTDNPLWGLDDN
jgi:hypothetical protein